MTRNHLTLVLSDPALGGSWKQTDLRTAQVPRGTCPDMCPEKERYLREDRKQLFVYEIIPGTDLVSSDFDLVL